MLNLINVKYSDNIRVRFSGKFTLNCKISEKIQKFNLKIFTKKTVKNYIIDQNKEIYDEDI